MYEPNSSHPPNPFYIVSESHLYIEDIFFASDEIEFISEIFEISKVKIMVFTSHQYNFMVSLKMENIFMFP